MHAMPISEVHRASLLAATERGSKIYFERIGYAVAARIDSEINRRRNSGARSNDIKERMKVYAYSVQ